MKIFENGNTYEIHMTKDEAATCYHSGPCDSDTAEMVRKHPRLVKRMRREVLIAAFREFGAWTKEELEAMSDDELRGIALWDAAGNIQDNEDSHGWAYIDGSWYMTHPDK